MTVNLRQVVKGRRNQDNFHRNLLQVGIGDYHIIFDISDLENIRELKFMEADASLVSQQFAVNTGFKMYHYFREPSDKSIKISLLEFSQDYSYYMVRTS